MTRIELKAKDGTAKGDDRRSAEDGGVGKGSFGTR